MSAKVLIIDDDSETVLSLSRALKSHGLVAEISGTSNPEKAIEQAQEIKPDVVILDLSLDKQRGVESGFKLLSELLEINSDIRIIVLTGHGSTEFGVRALALGASNFLTKPADIPHLAALIRDGIEQSNLRRSYVALVEKLSDEIGRVVIGESKGIEGVREELKQAGQTNQPVLLLGETGTGKGLCAAALHKFGKRQGESFVRYQASFASPDLVNSELFGHKKGAFTGATEDRKGLFVEADRGTLFLDEVSELPQQIQVLLLGVLQEKRFRPLGSNAEVNVDVRLICACNEDVSLAMESGKLRKDLYHRIAHCTITIPPLRDRLEDIAPLVQHILSEMQERDEISVHGIEPDALSKLQKHQWPGNVRELEAQIGSAAYRAQFDGRTRISVADIQIGSSSIEMSVGSSFHEQVSAFQRSIVEKALAKNDGNILRTAKELQIDRNTLRKMIRSR